MGGGKVKGQLSHETWWHLGVQGENEESPAVQSGRALPMGRCASPPWPLTIMLQTLSDIYTTPCT